MIFTIFLFVSAEHFTCIVKVLYSLLYTQALIAFTIKLRPEERVTWKESGSHKKVSLSKSKWQKENDCPKIDCKGEKKTY